MEASLPSTFIRSLKLNLLFCVPFLSHHHAKSTLKTIQESQHITLYHSPDHQLLTDWMLCATVFTFPSPCSFTLTNNNYVSKIVLTLSYGYPKFIKREMEYFFTFLLNPEVSNTVKQTTAAQWAAFGKLEFAPLHYSSGFFAHVGRVGTSESTGVLHCFSPLNCWNMRLVSDQLL